MSDGSYQAVVYSYPVHELVDGVWVEIESTNQNARGDVSPSDARSNIIDNFVWDGHGVQNNNAVGLDIGLRSGYRCRAFIRFATMPTIPAGSTITAATMTVNIVSGTSTANNAAAYQVDSYWESATIQWSDMPSLGTLQAASISHNNKTKYQFSCLEAVKDWYNGSTTGQNKNYGIMLRYADETINDYNSFYSADYSNAALRPSLTISYTPPDSEISVLEGYIKQLPLPDTTEAITWTSANTAVATVDSAGKVTGVKAGKVTITASAGSTELHTYMVYVKIEDGVYRIDNRDTNFYLAANSGALENATTILRSSTTDELPMLRQLWRVTYLAAGYYVIRPMHNQNMALHAKNGVSDVTTIGYNNTLSGVPAENRWTIEYLNGGYVFKCGGDSDQALRSNDTSPYTQVFTGSYASTSQYFRWYFEAGPYIEPKVLLLDTQTGAAVADKAIYLNPGQTKTLADMNIAISLVCANNNNQNAAWYSGSNSVEVGSSTGAITGITPGGNATISARYYYTSTYYEASYNVYVKSCPDGTYFMRCSAYDRYIQIDNRDSSNDFSTSGAKIEQWAYHGSDFQKWIITWRGSGYFSIINLESGMALTVPSGQTGSEEVYIGQETYTGNDRQLWKITATNKGKYKIKAKSAEGLTEDLVLTVGHGSFNNSNAVYIEQCQYTDDTFYNDEWFICSAVDIGMSTDDYLDSEVHDDLFAYYYGSIFSEAFAEPSNIGPFSATHHYNKDHNQTASPNDFSNIGAISNEIDFMVYIGHGHAADSHTTKPEYGNHLHYDCRIFGETHEYDGDEDMYTSCDPAGNVYTNGLKFGSNTSDLRWVWLYTCHFLAENDYVPRANLQGMMNGAHIVMGYGTQSFLCEPNVELFAQYLREGKTIIEAFFTAGIEAEGLYAHDNHLQKVLFIPQAENETIYSPMIHYEYDPADVKIATSYIKSADD